jgi:predicted site-specific integrase-resolvase
VFKLKETQRYYTQSQVARIMGVSRQAVWIWIKKGKIKTVIVAGKKVIPTEELKPQEESKKV